LLSLGWPPSVTEERTRAAGHEITQTSQPNHQHTEDFFWHGVKAWTPFSTEGAYKHNSGAPTDTTDHLPRLWEGGNDCPRGFILRCEEGAGRDLGAPMQ